MTHNLLSGTLSNQPNWYRVDSHFALLNIHQLCHIHFKYSIIVIVLVTVLVLTVLCCVCQFAVVMWVLTYIGGWFNGMTLLIIGQFLSFSSSSSGSSSSSRLADWMGDHSPDCTFFHTSSVVVVVAVVVAAAAAVAAVVMMWLLTYSFS